MPEIRQIWITTRIPTASEPEGAGETGFYFVEDGILRMCNEQGKPTGRHHKLWPEDDPHRLARKFTRDLWRQRTKAESSFNRQIVYPPWKPA
jgi:hypothetical protein